MNETNMENLSGYIINLIISFISNKVFEQFVLWIEKERIQAVQFEDQDGVCAKKVEGRNKRVKIKKYR